MSSHRRPAPTRLALLILGLLIAGISGAFIWHAQELERLALGDWEQRLALVADQRLATLERWQRERLADLTEVADNASLRLYLARLGGQPRPQAPELGYLRNLLQAAAEKLDLSQPPPSDGSERQRPLSHGLALHGTEGQRLVAVPGTPALSEANRKALISADLQPGLLPMTRNEQGQWLLHWRLPVFAAEGTDTPGEHTLIGYLVASEPADARLLPLLQPPVGPGEHWQTLLLRKSADQVERLGAAGHTGLAQAPLASTAQLMALAYRYPEQLLRGLDPDGQSALGLTRGLRGTPWRVLELVDEDHALGPVRQRIRYLLGALFLGLGIVVAVVIAAWQRSDSLRSRRLTEALHQQRQALAQRNAVLSAITDHMNDYILLLNAEHQIVFANPSLASRLGAEPSDLIGKSLTTIIGRDAYRGLQRAMDQGQPRVPVSLDLGGGTRLYDLHCQAIAEHGEYHDVSLLLLHDISAIDAAHRAQAQRLNDLIGALTSAMDKHDPFSAEHSSLTAALAEALARELHLPAEERQALITAARLANIGKLFIPSDLLAKSGSLTPAEQRLLMRHVDYALDILGQVEFEGPVLETLAQKQELLDGSGYPRQLSGEQILFTARILNVANTFVALVSPRAYRNAISPRKALETLFQATPTKLDSHVVAALAHLIENEPEVAGLFQAPATSG